MGIVIAISIVKVFAIAIGIAYFRFLEISHKLLLIQVLLALTTELSARYFAATYKTNNLWIFNIYTILEFWLLLLAGRYFISSRSFNKAITYAIVCITCIWITEIYLQGMSKWPTKTIISGSILVMILYFKALFDEVLFNKTSPFRLPIFWISLSVILFFGCILPFMALYNVFNTHYAELSSIFTNYLINVVNFLRYPMVGIAFYLHYKEKAGTDKIRRRYA